TDPVLPSRCHISGRGTEIRTSCGSRVESIRSSLSTLCIRSDARTTAGDGEVLHRSSAPCCQPPYSRQAAGQLHACRLDTRGIPSGAHHPCHARRGGHLPVLLL